MKEKKEKKRDWKKYNEQLVRRGEILIAIEWAEGGEEKEGGKEKRKKRGRPYKYSEGLIMALLILKFGLGLPYRQVEGVGRKIFGSMGIEVPNFRTIHYRFSKMEIGIEELIGEGGIEGEEVVIVIDSTGIKKTRRGEWRGRKKKKGGKKEKEGRKGWIKLHVAYDAKSKKILEVRVTTEKVADRSEGKELIEGAIKRVERMGGKVKKVIGDAGYDDARIFKYLERLGIEAVIKVRRDAVEGEIKSRNEIIKAIRKLGSKEWREKTGYNVRWLIESLFSAFKRWFGEYVSSIKFENIKREIMFKLYISALMLAA